jgi:hypothetical protein
VLDTQELRPVQDHKIEKGRVHAELFVLELQMERSGLTLQAAMDHKVLLPALLRRTLAACESA